MHRHLCEAADQWSGIALPDLVVQGREELVEATPAVEGAQPLIDVLSRPLRHLAVEFHRPAFFLDRLRQETRAYGADGGFSFTHQFVNESDELLATCVEWLAHLPAAREGST
jgi:acyl-CoA thioesterase FadM